MTDNERRKHLRHEVEIGITVSKKGEKVAAKIINISKGGIGLISEEEIMPGEKIDIRVNYVGSDAIQGAAKWKKTTTREGRTIYRMGIEADPILAPEELWKSVSSEAEK